MNDAKHYQVIILGSGPAGLTAAIYCARASLAPLLIHGPLVGGQLTTTTEVENFPGFPEGIMGPELMLQMEKQARRFGTEVLEDVVSEVRLAQQPLEIKTQGGLLLTCDAMIIATGAAAKMLGLQSERELMGYGVSTCATCDGAFFRNQEIAVIGGGDSACEEALFLTRFGSKIHLVHRRNELRASKIMRERVLQHNKIEVHWGKQIAEIHGSKKTGVTGMTLSDAASGQPSELKCQAVFLAVGHTPNSALFKGLLDMDQTGYLKPAPGSTRMNVDGVFACGDVCDHVFRQAITAAGTGCMAAIEVERWLEAREK